MRAKEVLIHLRTNKFRSGFAFCIDTPLFNYLYPTQKPICYSYFGMIFVEKLRNEKKKTFF